MVVIFLIVKLIAAAVFCFIWSGPINIDKNEIIEKNEDRQYNYCGPDIPCFLNIEKWIITKIRVRSGKTNV